MQLCFFVRILCSNQTIPTMKKILGLILVIASFQLVQAQTANPETEEETTVAANDTSEVEKALLKKLDELLQKDDEHDTLAYFELVGDAFVDLAGNTKTISRVEILIEDGAMQKARLFTKEGTVYETKYDALHLQRFHKFLEDYDVAFVDMLDPANAIPFSWIVRYFDKLDNSNYQPDDELLILTPGNKKKYLAINTNLNSYIDYRVYTDLLGLLGKTGNGLIQTEISSVITYNNFPISRRFFMFNHFKPYFNFSKFDSKFAYQSVQDSISDTYPINRILFNQLAYLDVGLSFNILTIKFFQHTADVLHAGVDFKYSDIKRGLSGEQQTLNAFAYYVGTSAQLKKYKNFGLDLTLRFYNQRIQNKEVSESVYFDPYLYADFSLFYHPKGNQNNSIFLRFRSLNEAATRDYFTQLQVGYKSKLNINFKKGKK